MSENQTEQNQVIRSAHHQTTVDRNSILQSTNCGLIVHRVGVAKAEFRSESRIFARDLAEYITKTKVGVASVFVYEETFGQKDVIHWLLHISGLDAYENMVQMGSSDSEFRDIFFKSYVGQEKGGGTWNRLFMDGSLRETVLMPQFYGMYGTTMENEGGLGSFSKLAAPTRPTAATQTESKQAIDLNTASAGIVVMRSGQAKSRYRGEARVFARAVAASINEALPGEASAFLYEEAFGVSDRVHWIIHMKNLSTYYRLIDMHAAMNPKIVEIYTRDWIAPEKGGGNWSQIFLDGSFVDLALTPHQWNIYATKS